MSSSIKIKDTSQIQINIKQDIKLQGRYYTLDQVHDTLECLFCCICEGPNQYSVAESDPNYSVNNKKGYIKEQSDCFTRMLCVCNRPFQAQLKLFNQEIAVAQRPCKCCLEYMPCCENQVIVSNKTGRILGHLRVDCWCFSGNIFKCADAKIQIYSGETQELLYTVQGTYCQKSIFCPFFRCCYCPTVEYIIFDKVNLKVGKIFNIYNGCFTQCFTRTSKFGIQLPPKADEDQRILLLFAAMYLDYLRYDTPYFCLGFR